MKLAIPMETKIAIKVDSDAGTIHWVSVFAPQTILFLKEAYFIFKYR